MLPGALLKIACTTLMASPAETMIDEGEKNEFELIHEYLMIQLIHVTLVMVGSRSACCMQGNRH